MAKSTTSTTVEARCACGCSKPVNVGSNFLQGHDQRLRGQLRRDEPQKPVTRAFLKANPSFLSGHTKKAAKPAVKLVSAKKAVAPAAKGKAAPVRGTRAAIAEKGRRTVPSVTLEDEVEDEE
jgi:hypothetical protein